jgi:tRNA A-37 threonylcarbamoyl transferase component Bud32
MQDRRPASSGSSESIALDRLFDPDAPLSYEDRLEMLIAAALPHAGPRLSFGSEIARGGMGAVKTVFDEVLQRRMAAKTMHARTYEHLILVHGFLREAQVTGQLDHPNIVPIHELGRDEHGQLYFTMKLVEGRSLKALIGGEAACDHDRLINLLEHFLKVCDALAFAHSRGVIHCDIKSANVMVGSYGEVYLMDWGGAQILPPKEGADQGLWVRDTLPRLPDSETQGLVFGTPSYMSPEQASGGRIPLDERSDVFSMGALLYEIMTGKPPYVASTAMEALLLAQQAEVRPPDAVVGAGTFPRELVRIVMKALEPHPDDRYQSVGELRFDIIKLLRGSGSFPVVRFAAGDHVIREGEDGDAAYIVQSGRLQVYKEEGGTCVELRVLGPGDMFGETAIFARSRRTASVVCLEPAVLQRITSDLIEEEMASMKPWMGKLIQTLAARFGGVAPTRIAPASAAPRTAAPRTAAPMTATPRAPEPAAAESVVIDIDEVPGAPGSGDSDIYVSVLAPKE